LRTFLLASVVLVTGVATVAVLALGGLLPEPARLAIDDYGQLAAALCATGALVRSAARAIPGDRVWRALLAIAIGGWSFGQAMWTWYQIVDHRDLPSPSLADVGYFMLPVFALPALWVFPTRAQAGASAGARWFGLPDSRPYARLVFVLDSLVVVGSLLLITWTTSLGVVLGDLSTADMPQFLVAVAYPVTDLVLVVFVVLLARFRAPAAPWALLMFGLGAVCVAASDSR
jgi:hypothetical protein